MKEEITNENRNFDCYILNQNLLNVDENFPVTWNTEHLMCHSFINHLTQYV